MPRPKRAPAYSLHKPSGQARVILDGRHVYLGPHDSPQSREKYARLLAERTRPGATPRAMPAMKVPQSDSPICPSTNCSCVTWSSQRPIT